MHLLFNGMITTGMTECPGKLLLTKKSAFLLADTEDVKNAALFFGIVGVLLSLFISRMRAGNSEPAFLADQDLADLTSKDKKKLLYTEALAKFSFSPSLVVNPTKMGFRFLDGTASGTFSGFMHKKKISVFLQTQGISVTPTI